MLKNIYEFKYTLILREAKNRHHSCKNITDVHKKFDKHYKHII